SKSVESTEELGSNCANDSDSKDSKNQIGSPVRVKTKGRQPNKRYKSSGEGRKTVKKARLEEAK
ncbi:hypothetical protein BGZ76_004762, partial [Entomortierella beljakovae]